MKFVQDINLVIINNYATLTQKSFSLAIEFQENIANEIKNK